MIAALKRLESHMEREAQKVQDDICNRFDDILRAQLENWQNRFKRHRFSAYYAHGMLNFQVQPNIAGEEFPEYLDSGRGAIGILGKEAKAFQDMFNGMSYKIEPVPLTGIIELEKRAGTL